MDVIGVFYSDIFQQLGYFIIYEKKQLEKLSTYTNFKTFSKLDNVVEFKSFIKSDNVVTFKSVPNFSMW